MKRWPTMDVFLVGVMVGLIVALGLIWLAEVLVP